VKRAEAVMATFASSAVAGTLQTFTFQNATNPAVEGGVLDNGLRYWGDHHR